MKRLLGLLLVLGMVGWGGDAPQPMEGSSAVDITDVREPDAPKPDVAKPGGQELHTLTGHITLVSSVSFSPDGQRIVSGSFDKTARIWDASE